MTGDLPDSRSDSGALPGRGKGTSPAWLRYAAALVMSAVTTLIAIPLHQTFELANIVMLYLLAVVPVSYQKFQEAEQHFFDTARSRRFHLLLELGFQYRIVDFDGHWAKFSTSAGNRGRTLQRKKRIGL